MYVTLNSTGSRALGEDNSNGVSFYSAATGSPCKVAGHTLRKHLPAMELGAKQLLKFSSSGLPPTDVGYCGVQTTAV